MVDTLTESVDGVLLPVVDIGMPPREAWADDETRLARTLYAQCPSTGPNRVVLVIGASSSSGSAVVASLFEEAAAESRPTAATMTDRGNHSAPASADTMATRVVHGGAVGDSRLTPDTIAVATDIVLVARLEADTVARALALRSVTAASAAPVVAVFTCHTGLRWVPRKRRPDVNDEDRSRV